MYDIRGVAFDHGGYYELEVHPRDRYHKLMFRNDQDFESAVTVTVWFTGVVATHMDHNYRGWNMLYRRDIDGDLNMLAEIFDNPRSHTGRGYRYRRGY